VNPGKWKGHDMRSYTRLGIVLAVASVVLGCDKPISSEFSMSKSSGQAPLTVDFTNLTEGGDGYQWDFGDGSESTEQALSRTYTKAGTHTVTLHVVEGGKVQDTSPATHVVTVEPGPLSRLVLEETQLTLMPQGEHAFSVKARDEFDNPVSDFDLTFRSVEQAGRVDNQSKFTAGTKPGRYAEAVTIEATQAGVTKSVSVDVTIHPGPPERVVVSPSDVTLAAGQQQKFDATAFDAFDNEIQGIKVAWKAGTAGSVDANGRFTTGSDSGLFPDTIKATVLKGNEQAVGTASVGIPLTIGPYTWPPGKSASRPTSFEPKHRFCFAALSATPSPDFPNPYDSIRGPVEVAYLRDLKAAGHKLLHHDWTGHVDALTAGKTARVTLYPEENFSGEPHILEPGEKFKLEDSQLEQVASLKIEYVP
jgi:PKD repeat protein